MKEDTRKILEVTDAFRTGAIFGTDDNKLNEYLGFILDADRNLYHAVGGKFDSAVIAPLISTILSIKQQRMSLAIEESNMRTQKLVIRLTWVAVALGAIQAGAAIISFFR